MLDTQKKTHWLESNLGPLKITSPTAVVNPEQSLAYTLKNPHTQKPHEPKIQREIYRSWLFVPLTVLVTAY